MSEEIEVMISEEDVEKRIKELGEQISKDYEGKTLHLVCILKGAAFFATELAKRITIPVRIDFMSTSSYAEESVSSGNVKVTHELDLDPEGQDVLVVEDIIDSGNTLHFLEKYFKDKKARSVKFCVMLDKPERREVEVKVSYLGFTIPDKFVVGYGLDYAQKYRNLPYIGVVSVD